MGAGDSRKSYNYLLFDWDGCLAKTLDLWHVSIESSLSDFGIRGISNSEIIAMFGNLYSQSLKAGITPDGYLEFKNKVNTKFEEGIEKITLYEGAEELMRNLKSDKKSLALISSSPRALLDKMLEVTNMRDYFDIVVSGSDVEKRKPQPEGIEKVIS